MKCLEISYQDIQELLLKMAYTYKVIKPAQCGLGLTLIKGEFKLKTTFHMPLLEQGIVKKNQKLNLPVSLIKVQPFTMIIPICHYLSPA